MNDKNVSIHDQLSLDDRQAAERKLYRLIKSFGINALDARGRLIDPYLDRAAALWRPHVGSDFAALAGQEAEADLESWFAALLGDRLEDRAMAVMTGRAAFLIIDGPIRWADQLLKPIDNLDPAFIEAITDQTPSAVPPSEIGEMHHQPYEAWLPSATAFRVRVPEAGGFLPSGFLQSLSGLMRRDLRAASIRWPGTGSAS